MNINVICFLIVTFIAIICGAIEYKMKLPDWKLLIVWTKDCYDGDARTAIENSGFYEQFEDWIAEQDSKGIYPELIGKAPTSISVMQKGYLFDLDTDLGQYEIQCKLEYEQEV